MKILFSVIIPTYNAQKTIIPILEQINKSNFNKNIEIIIIDSSSTDKTVFLLKGFFNKIKIPNKIIKITKKSFNHGLTRNLGVKKAKGRYVLFLSQDVIIKNLNIFKYFKEDFSKHKATVIFGKQAPLGSTPFIQQLESKIIFDNLDQHVNKKGILIQNINKPFIDYSNDNLYLWYFLSDVCACYKRSFLLKNPFPKVKTGEDIITGRNIIDNRKTKIYDSRVLIHHSHSYNIIEYYKREKQEYKLVTNELKLKKKIRFFYKVNKIFISDNTLYKKTVILIELFIYYIVKAIIFVKNTYDPKKDN